MNFNIKFYENSTIYKTAVLKIMVATYDDMIETV